MYQPQNSSDVSVSEMSYRFVDVVAQSHTAFMIKVVVLCTIWDPLTVGAVVKVRSEISPYQVLCSE